MVVKKKKLEKYFVEVKLNSSIENFYFNEHININHDYVWENSEFVIIKKQHISKKYNYTLKRNKWKY